ncbi:MAG TPA: cytoplasmic protein [Chloroflexia bacterium]|nr:cytoplasmic protein [Chloroflexia bacterium]
MQNQEAKLNVLAAPMGHRVLFENERVRVLDVQIKPGETSEMHIHPASVIYALNSSRVVFSFPDGTSREVTAHEGDVTWTDGTTHEVRNIGETVDRGIIVELKQ